MVNIRKWSQKDASGSLRFKRNGRKGLVINQFSVMNLRSGPWNRSFVLGLKRIYCFERAWRPSWGFLGPLLVAVVLLFFLFIFLFLRTFRSRLSFSLFNLIQCVTFFLKRKKVTKERTDKYNYRLLYSEVKAL